MIGHSLKTAVIDILTKDPNVVFLVDGDSMKGTFSTLPEYSDNNFIYVRDYMALGHAVPQILSHEYIKIRAQSLSDPLGAQYTSEEYEQEIASPIKRLSEQIDKRIILVQYDCYISKIWQLTMMAYLEQIGYIDTITRLCFYDDCIFDFKVSAFDKISVKGAHKAYCQIICEHKKSDVSRYLINEEAVDCYLDINSANGLLNKYICGKSIFYDNPFTACGVFLHDFPKWGLGDGEFLIIALQTFSQNPQYAHIARKWEEHIKNFCNQNDVNVDL